jgi:CRP-like cAMP-binding protein
MEPSESAKSGAPGYDMKAALEFFKSEGEVDSFDAGGVIFAENEKAGRFSLKRNKMYLLLEGQVNLIANGKFLGMVGPGEVFGEMASLSQAPRSASAMARGACRVISLDDKQFQNALQRRPEFALMMMGVIIGRLRQSLAQVKKENAPAPGAGQGEVRVFERKLLNELLQELGEDARVVYDQGRIIMQEGQVGVLMYIVLEGRVSIVIKGAVVEQIGAGAVFGEMALVEKGPRLASAVADTRCTLLGINRNAFLELVKSKPQFGMSLLSAIGERARVTTTRI